MMHLKKFERTIFLLIALSILLATVLGLIAWYLTSETLGLSASISSAATIITWATAATLFSYSAARAALAPTSALFRALDHVSSTPSEAAPPKPKEHTLSHSLVEIVLKDVYQLSSGQSEEQTKLSSTKEYNEAVMQLQSNAVLALDRNATIRYANAAARALMPPSIDDPIGLTLGDTIAPDFSSGLAFNEWLSDASANKIEDRYIWERARVSADDATPKYFDMVADYHKNESHGAEVIVMLIDKTESYHTDDTSLSFVSLAVHELRSPIGLIRGYIELFEDEVGPSLNEDQRNFMLKMSASAGQLSTFVNNILNVARIENDDLKVHMHKDSMKAFLETSLEDFTLRATVHSRKLTYELKEDLPNVGIDRVGLYEVMSNLIDNAIKYSPEGDEIIIKAERGNGSGVTVSVQDHGVGIPASAMKNLFERFYRSHHSKDQVSGTGLGLFLSKTLIEAHSGNIWVKSVEGQGSTFGFDLQAFSDLQQESGDSDDIMVRSAHGWIKNHGKMRK